MEKQKNGKNLWDYCKCNKPQKQMLHDVCLNRGVFKFQCSVDNQNCIAYLGNLTNLKTIKMQIIKCKNCEYEGVALTDVLKLAKDRCPKCGSDKLTGIER